MIILGLVLLSVSLFTVFQSEDGLDFSRALLRVLLSCLILFFAKFYFSGTCARRGAD